jgi:hypothetical protein
MRRHQRARIAETGLHRAVGAGGHDRQEKSPKRSERLLEAIIRDEDVEPDFTAVIKPIEKAAGVVVGGGKAGTRRGRSWPVTDGAVRGSVSVCVVPGWQVRPNGVTF